MKVQDEWEDSLPHEMSPREYFGEMCPLFASTEIEFKDIGAYMQEHVKRHQLSEVIVLIPPSS